MRAPPPVTCGRCAAVLANHAREILKEARRLVSTGLLDPRHRPQSMLRQVVQEFHDAGHPKAAA